MFFKKKISKDSFTSLIGEDTKVNGNITIDGILSIQGFLDGDFIRPAADEKNNGKLTVIVGKSGELHTQLVECENAFIDNVVKSAELKVENVLQLGSSARLFNVTIYHRHLIINEGALLVNCVLKHLDYCSEGEKV